MKEVGDKESGGELELQENKETGEKEQPEDEKQERELNKAKETYDKLPESMRAQIDEKHGKFCEGEKDDNKCRENYINTINDIKSGYDERIQNTDELKEMPAPGEGKEASGSTFEAMGAKEKYDALPGNVRAQIDEKHEKFCAEHPDDDEACSENFERMADDLYDAQIPDSLKTTFSEYRYAVTAEDTKVYRVYDDHSSYMMGGFWSTEKPVDRMSVKENSALKDEWNMHTKYAEATIPKGTPVIEGKAAPQETASGNTLSGGGEQLCPLPDMRPEWVTERDRELPEVKTGYGEWDKKVEDKYGT